MRIDQLYRGDCVNLLAAWRPRWADLIFADPPYNIGYDYDNYDDNRPRAEYLDWSRRWMKACRRSLKPRGSLYVAIGDDYAADLRNIGRRLGLQLRNWIIWTYTFGQSTTKKFCRSHTHILYFTRHATRFTFNDRSLRFPSARHTTYQDKRACPSGRLPNDVWNEFPRVCGTFRERVGPHGCQMPEALLMRIILASSNPGDVVLDPFVGSGTTAAVAKRLGRRYVGIDVSKQYIDSARERLAEVSDESTAKHTGLTWPALHVEMLRQLYRETAVSINRILLNATVMNVLARCLSWRTGDRYSADDVRGRLCRLARKGKLPTLPNDTAFDPALAPKTCRVRRMKAS